MWNLQLGDQSQQAGLHLLVEKIVQLGYFFRKSSMNLVT